MIKISDRTKIYVHCPQNVVSGGAELLHQLVSYLRDNGIDAYIYYYVKNGDGLIPNDYRKYNIQIAEKIDDESDHIEVLFEPRFHIAARKTNTQKILWWLSVDNFYRCCDNYLNIRDIAKWSISHAFYVFARRCYYLLFKKTNLFKNSLSLRQISRLNVINAYQSEYAQFFLLKNGFREIVPLKDYINIDHCQSFKKEGRENIVLYNPKKGLSFTKKLIKMSPELKWIPIENLSRQDVIRLMNKAKVYVDFGFHPGKDRLPRECAMNGLCIITGYKGSARYFEDVWIDPKYKFDENKDSKADIIKMIKTVLEQYEILVDDFGYYRYRISIEKAEFENQVKQLFCRHTPI